jgi:hypothetical protein
MGESNQVAVRISAESTWGETPSSPTMQALLRTGGGIEGTKETVVSNSVSTTRMRRSLYMTGKGAEGGYDFELAYGQYDLPLEHALCGDWSSAVAMAETTISADTTDDSFNDSGSGFVSEGIQAGMWILVAGFANAGNNGLFKVGTVAAGKVVPSARIDLTTQLYSTTVQLTTEAAGASVTIKNAGMLRNGTTAKSLFVEEYHGDTTDFYQYTGFRVNTLDLEIAAKSLVTGSFRGTGKTFDRTGATLSGSVTAVNANEAFNTSSHIWGINEGDASCAESIQRIAMSLNNNTRYNDAVGNIFPVAIPYGTQDLTGSLSVYNAAGTDALIDKYMDFTETEFSFVISNGSSPLYYVLSFPKLKLSKGAPQAGGLDEDTMADFEWTAYSGGNTYQIQIDRISTT